MSDPRRRPRRRPRLDPARLARIEELRLGLEQRLAYIREQFPHAAWAHGRVNIYRPRRKPAAANPPHSPPRAPRP